MKNNAQFVNSFPVSGFDTYICGTPRYDRAVMHLQTGDLVIRRDRKGI